MASPLRSTNTYRAPLSELPLHHFVCQSLAASPQTSPDKLLKTPSRSRSRSPSLPTSRRNSTSVSPHKQAVLQNHRLVREGSVASPSSTAKETDNMADVDFALLPRRLFDDCSSKRASSDDPLETSPVLPGSASSRSRFSPHNIKHLAHHSPSSRPTTPKGATTTPLNLRQHRPPHTSGPKPTQFIEPSPTTQRISEPRLPISHRYEHADAPTTPSRIRKQANPPIASVPHAPASSMDGDHAAAQGGITPLEEPTRLASSALQSLPKKKHRVSPTEIAIAHEEAGAGPIASPSPRKMADYFAPSDENASAFSFDRTRLRSDSISDRQQAAAAFQNLTDMAASKQPLNSLTLAKSGLFLGVVARPLPGWTVYEDTNLSSDTAPSQDHAQPMTDEASVAAVSPVSSPNHSPAKQSAASTPNKENRVPDAAFLASKPVPIALPDRAYSVDGIPTKTRSSSRLASAAASPVASASRKRGTGGRLSLLADADADADADDEDVHRDASLQLDGDETLAPSLTASGKKLRSKGTASPRHGSRKASSHQRKASAGKGLESGRTSRKASSSHQHAVDSPQRVADAAALDAVASRTRSRSRF
ncbi:hypothetical protein EX895_006163 [Sporisorium graminicola]|uniref:Uncharacterized protein n=1 Tax=Sporisorium graminicola TaxID=280036 RepID=A0A4U7KM31_9BASI|nr:hypothetical protein EX895_006163 [Sporisorium graminicola]TKY85083.1 hypothetical protein EX895_006163 [Sporisorium graminicola]